MSIKTFKDTVLAKFFSRFPVLVELWAKSHKFVVNATIPWTDLSKDINECRIALVTTAGVHLKSQPPYDMENQEGDPSFREIPSNTPLSDLMITHNYYDHKDADSDVNVVLPMERLKELEAEGIIKGIASRHFSFMGHILGRHIEKLIKQTGPEVARMLKGDQNDIVFLTPA
ncbi:MAG: glycine/sarcosine/betaine reductase selenoprotein B family protein [Pseudomonadota bacterium]